MPVSLNPKSFTSGGLIDDVDVTLKELRFTEWDYQGQIAAILALKATLGTEAEDYEQYYSAGDLQYFVPDADGKSITAVGTRSALVSTSNAAQFITSLINAGFPEDKVGDNIAVFEGTQCHVRRVLQPKRPGLKQAESDREKTILLVDKIHQLPWEGKAKGKTPAKAVGKATAKPTTGQAADLDEQATNIVLNLLASHDGGIPKAKIAALAFQETNRHEELRPSVGRIVKRIFEDSFLSEADKPWTYDGKTISLSAPGTEDDIPF